MSRLQMTGLASGMDTRTMVDQLMEIERRPIYLKENEIRNVQFQKRHWDDIGRQVRQFRGTAQEMTRTNVFKQKISTVSNERVANVDIGPNAQNGTYIIEDIQLARPGQATSTFEIPLDKEVKNNVTSGRLNIRNLNTRFIDIFSSPIGTTNFQEVGFKVNGRAIGVESRDTIGTFINKINASGAGVRASFDIEENRIKIESETEAPVEISADDNSFLRGLNLGQYNGRRVENRMDAGYRRVMSEVDPLKDVERGFFTINDYTVEVNPDFDSVQSIISKLNVEESPVRAYFDEGSNKFSIVAREAGDDVFIQDDTSGFLEAMGLLEPSPLMSRRNTTALFQGEKASFTIDGVRYERDRNEMIINGIKINLLGNSEENERITITVDNDYEAMMATIENFVEGYNETVALINSKTVKDAPLQGNTTANTLASNLRRFMGSSVNGVDSRYSQLAMIGINTLGKEANLVIDYNKLERALRENPEEVEKLFRQDAKTQASEVVAAGDGRKTEFQTRVTRRNIDEMQVRVGDKVYTRDGRNRLLMKSELAQNKLSKADMIKYVINREVRTKADMDIMLGQGVPNNAVVVDDITGALEFGSPPSRGEEIVVESSRSVNQSRFGFDDGLSNQVNNYLSPFVSFGGTLERQSRAYDNRINQMNEWISRTDDRLKMREDALKRQFAGMEGSMQYSNSQSNWLSGQIAQLQRG